MLWCKINSLLTESRERMSKKELVKRYILFVISLFFCGVGIAFTKHAELGVSPISSLANVISIKFDFISFGSWLIVSNLVLLLGQIILLRRNFRLIQLVQIPLSFIFGYFTDFGLWMIKDIPNENYIVRLLLVFAGIVFIGFGISLGVIADVVLNSGEGLVKALADVTKKDFGTVKIVFDVSWVLFSIVLSLILFDGKLLGTREGTVLSAVFVGVAVKIFKPILQNPLTKILKK